jgi:phosphoribosylanthranilate isomerase
MVRVKICGITNLGDALSSIKAGCDALGFVFYKKSPRYITPEKASRLIRQLPARIIKIGVFANAREKTIRHIAQLCHLDMLQFHGNESARFCDKFRNYKIIKAFRVKDRIDLAKIIRYSTFAYLFDTFVESKLGGTGKRFNWNLCADLAKIKQPIFLSGGLTAKNVKQAIKTLHPDWVDVSSSVEIRPGKKDYNKIVRFIKAVKDSN